jgi:tRNA-dihydrouridine synthase B
MNIDHLTSKKLWLAPLAGFTDAPFRYIAKLCGADVLVSEMVSADGVKKNFEKMAHYTKFSEFERPFGIQLFGDNPTVMARAAQLLSQLRPDFFDINMGCPVKKVVKRYAGSAMMLRPDLAEANIRAVVKVLDDQGIPLTVKIRAGWDFDSINAVPFAQMCECAGASAITVHPRTRSQFFTGKSDWDITRQVKEAVSIPVIGNGDLVSVTDVDAMYTQTGCDSVMIGRGALGKPWFFSEIKGDFFDNTRYLKSSTIEPLCTPLDVVFRHIDRALSHAQDEKVMIPMRAHFSFYTKGYKNCSDARKKIFSTTDANAIKQIFQSLFNAGIAGSEDNHCE